MWYLYIFLLTKFVSVWVWVMFLSRYYWSEINVGHFVIILFTITFDTKYDIS